MTATLTGTEFFRVTPLRADGTVSPFDEQITLNDVAGFAGGGTDVAEEIATSIASLVPTTLVTTQPAGSRGLNSPGDPTLSLQLAKWLAALNGNQLPIERVENNVNYGCFGVFASAASAAASGVVGAQVNFNQVWNAGLAASAAPGGPFFKITDGDYFVTGNNAKAAVLQLIPFAKIVSSPKVTITSTYNNGGFDGIVSTSAVQGKVNNVTWVGGVTLQKMATHWENWFDGTLTTDVENFLTVLDGDRTGITDYLPGGWQSSGSVLFQANGFVIHFDTLPPGFSTLAQLQASLPNGNIYLQNTQYGQNGPYTTKGAITASGGGGFDVTVQVSVPGTQPFEFNSIGAVAAQAAVVRSQTSPEIVPRPAIAPPTWYFLSATPVIYSGNGFVYFGDNAIFENIIVRNITQGRSFFVGGDRCRYYQPECRTTNGSSGSAGFRYFGGRYTTIYNASIYCGDAGLQFVVGNNYSSDTGFDYKSNLDILHCDFVGGEVCSLHGFAMQVACNIADAQQTVLWATATSTAPGNTLVMTPLTTTQTSLGLTLASLQASAQNWAAGSYNLNDRFILNGFLYTVTQAGTSVNGPTGTGSNISDGGTALFAYVSPGQTYFPNIRGNGNPGSFVLGQTVVQNGDGTVTMQLQPGPGYSQAIFTRFIAGRQLFFTAGTPTGIMTCSISQSGYFDIRAINVGLCGLFVGNTDSTGTSSIFCQSCTFDGSWKFIERSKNNIVINLNGNGLGGISVDFVDNTISSPWDQGLGVLGNVWKLNCSGNTFGPTRDPAVTVPPIYISGVQSGTFERNEVWGAGLALPVVQIGDADGVENTGIVDYNSTSNFAFEKNQVRAIPNGQPGVVLTRGSNVTLKGNLLYQAAPLGSGSGAIGIQNTSNMLNAVAYENFFAVDQAAYFGSPIGIGFFDRIVTGASATQPTPTISTGGGSSVAYDFVTYFNSIPTTRPTTTGTVWNNAGVLSLTSGAVTSGQVQVFGTGGATFDFATYAANLPTTRPSSSGIPWNNGGTITRS